MATAVPGSKLAKKIANPVLILDCENDDDESPDKDGDEFEPVLAIFEIVDQRDGMENGVGNRAGRRLRLAALRARGARCPIRGTEGARHLCQPRRSEAR